MTRVVHLKVEPYDVYIGRASRDNDGYFGNPFKLVNYHSWAERTRVIEKFRVYFHKRIAEDPAFREAIHSLKGKTLGCFCKPMACHGDVIVEYLNSI